MRMKMEVEGYQHIVYNEYSCVLCGKNQKHATKKRKGIRKKKEKGERKREKGERKEREKKRKESAIIQSVYQKSIDNNKED
jgi:hypothetical protein